MISNKQAATSSGYKKLIAWQRADNLAERVYEITAKYPRSEIFGLTSQIRRAALSVPANIIEGYSRVNRNEFRTFLRIALASLSELEYLLYFSSKQNYIKDKEYKEV